MNAICKVKTETYTANGVLEIGRFIAVGDRCTLAPNIAPNLLVAITYPVGGGTRSAYIRDLANFTLG